MERIEALIKQLNQQYQQNVDTEQLLGTIQLLQFELMKLKVNNQQTLGTAKVAVVLPFAKAVGQAAGYEQYAPKPIEEISVVEERPIEKNEEKEAAPIVDNKIAVENKDNLTVVPKGGQLDIFSDTINEIPTLSAQHREINDTAAQSESLNDRLKQGKTELVEVLKEVPVRDLRKAVGINDRFLYINELFRGDENMYDRCIKTINNFNIYPEAEYWISRELKVKLGWDNDNEVVKQFDQLVKRRFS